MDLEEAAQTGQQEPTVKENPQPSTSVLCCESTLALGLSKRDCARVCSVFTWFSSSSKDNDDFLL
jgi:hypothetical protein